MTVYYVRQDGSDGNTGTANTSGGAWLTARASSRKLAPGDELNFVATNGGDTVFVETAGPAIDYATNTTGGFGTDWTAGQKITIKANDGDEGKIILMRNTSGGTAVVDIRAFDATNEAAFIEFRNLIFDGFKPPAANNGFVPVYITNNGRTDNAPHDFRFYGCELRNSGQSSGILQECDNTNIAGICSNVFFGADPTTGRRGSSHHNGLSGQQHGMYFQGMNTTIEDTDVYANMGLGIQVHRDTPITGNCRNTTIRRVRSYGNNSSGIYIDFDDNGLIENCLAYDNGTHGIRFDDGAANGKIYNCTSVRNRTSNYALAQSAAVTNISIVNCIARKLGVTTNNLSEATATPTITTCINVATSDTDATDPGFVNPDGNDFHLLSTSAAIGGGTDLSGTFTNDLELNTRALPYDRGCYQYVLPYKVFPYLNLKVG